MGFYNDYILPRLLDLAMRNKQLLPFRKRVIGAAEGRVLEIGVGSGRNLPFYRSPVNEILALEPSQKLVAMARGAAKPSVPVHFLEASAETIPLDDDTIDSVVTTWTLCSSPQAASARCAGCFGLAASSCSPSTAWRPLRACVGGRTA